MSDDDADECVGAGGGGGGSSWGARTFINRV
jgi:hypothetical protein